MINDHFSLSLHACIFIIAIDTVDYVYMCTLLVFFAKRQAMKIKAGVRSDLKLPLVHIYTCIL